MTWPQTLTVALAPTLITGLSLLAQLWLTTRSEASRTKELRSLERRDALEDKWRDDRRASHARLLALIDESWPPIQSEIQWQDMLRQGVPHFKEEDLAYPLDHGFTTRMRDAMAEVDLIASERARSLAKGCVDRILTLNFALWTMKSQAERAPISIERLAPMFNEARGLHGEYVEAVRGDLGTAGV